MYSMPSRRALGASLQGARINCSSHPSGYGRLAVGGGAPAGAAWVAQTPPPAPLLACHTARTAAPPPTGVSRSGGREPVVAMSAQSCNQCKAAASCKRTRSAVAPHLPRRVVRVAVERTNVLANLVDRLEAGERSRARADDVRRRAHLLPRRLGRALRRPVRRRGLRARRGAQPWCTRNCCMQRLVARNVAGALLAPFCPPRLRLRPSLVC